MSASQPFPYCRSALTLAVSATFTSGTALAQDTTKLEPVVVTASGFEQVILNP